MLWNLNQWWIHIPISKNIYGIIQYEGIEKSFNQMFLATFHEPFWESNESREISLKKLNRFTPRTACNSKGFVVTPTTVPYVTCLGNPWTTGYKILSIPNPFSKVKFRLKEVNWYLQVTCLLITRVKSNARDLISRSIVLTRKVSSGKSLFSHLLRSNVCWLLNY